MKTMFKKNLLIIFIAIIIAIAIPTSVQAAGSFSLNKSSASITTGGTTTITITASNCAGQFSISSSNTGVATVSTSSVWLDNSSTTITVTAKAAGTANINIKAVDVTDTDLNDVTGTKSCAITVSAPVQQPKPEAPSNTGSSNTGSSGNSSGTTKPNNNTTVVKSSNSKLGSLKIAEGTITPEFNSRTTEYSISVSNEVTKLSISAIADSSKATVKITGNEELQVGENNIQVVVTAEDGSKTTYKILAKRAQPDLSLQALTALYINENGEKVELPLNPQFTFNIYEYNIDTILPHTVKNLEIIGTANRENAKIEILDNEELKTGENKITIKVTITDDAGLEEQKTYTITVEKEEEPVIAPLTMMEKIKRWFSGAGTTVTTLIADNFNKIITGMLVVATVAFVGLTIYFAYDYKNYQKLLAKLADYNKQNLNKRANVALNPENINIEEIENEEVNNNEEEIIEEENKKVKTGKGKRFK